MQYFVHTLGVVFVLLLFVDVVCCYCLLLLSSQAGRGGRVVLEIVFVTGLFVALLTA